MSRILGVLLNTAKDDKGLQIDVLNTAKNDKGLDNPNPVFPKVGSTEFWGSIKESKGFHEQMSCYPVF